MADLILPIDRLQQQESRDKDGFLVFSKQPHLHNKLTVFLPYTALVFRQQENEVLTQPLDKNGYVTFHPEKLVPISDIPIDCYVLLHRGFGEVHIVRMTNGGVLLRRYKSRNAKKDRLIEKVMGAQNLASELRRMSFDSRPKFSYPY